jgi:hypothetical protein
MEPSLEGAAIEEVVLPKEIPMYAMFWASKWCFDDFLCGSQGFSLKNLHKFSWKTGSRPGEVNININTLEGSESRMR